MNELFKEAREHGAVPLNEATRSSSDDKPKVSAVLKLYCFWEVERYLDMCLGKAFAIFLAPIVENDCSPRNFSFSIWQQLENFRPCSLEVILTFPCSPIL